MRCGSLYRIPVWGSVIGTGRLAVPVLAGTAAYAVACRPGWHVSLNQRPPQAIWFYSVIGLALLVGLAVDWTSVDPMQALFWSAVINGVVAVRLMVATMVAVTRRQVMGRFVASPREIRPGLAATAVMAVAVLAMFATMGQG